MLCSQAANEEMRPRWAKSLRDLSWFLNTFILMSLLPCPQTFGCQCKQESSWFVRLVALALTGSHLSLLASEWAPLKTQQKPRGSSETEHSAWPQSCQVAQSVPYTHDPASVSSAGISGMCHHTSVMWAGAASRMPNTLSAGLSLKFLSSSFFLKNSLDLFLYVCMYVCLSVVPAWVYVYHVCA